MGWWWIDGKPARKTLRKCALIYIDQFCTPEGVISGGGEVRPPSPACCMGSVRIAVPELKEAEDDSIVDIKS